MNKAAGFIAFLLVLSCAVAAQAQTLSNASLTGKYYFVQLLITTSSTGTPTTVSNLGGSITFNGGGSFTFSGNLGTNTAAAASASGNGTYSLLPDGSVTLTSPIRSTLTINARLSADQEVVLGSTTEDTADITGDLFVAVKAPTSNTANASLNGTYIGSTLSLPNGATTALSSSLFSLVPNGSGQFTSATVTGHEADQFDANKSQTLSGATYAMNADGTGAANFGSSASLLTGSDSVFISSDGNYLLGFGTAAGQRNILLATKSVAAPASNSSLSGRYWIAELDYDDAGGFVNSASGSFAAGGNQSNLLSERLNGAFSVTSLYYDAVSANGLGQFASYSEPGLLNMALGAPVTSGGTSKPTAMVGAQIDLPGFATTYYGIFFAVLAPTFTPAGGSVFLYPNGAVNAATFAPSPNAVAPGDIVALFGSGLSPVTDTPGVLPLMTSDQGVSVSIFYDGTTGTVKVVAAPLFFISSGQINIQIPFEVAGNGSISIQVTNNGQQSNRITLPLAPGDPGIFMWADSSSPYHAAAEHLNGSLITPSNPATRGETIMVFATGLGVLTPAVLTGAPNPGPTPATSPDMNVHVLFTNEAGTNSFAGGAPTFVGLNQINVMIPTDAITGLLVPMQIESSYGYSNVANLALQ